MFCLGLSRQLLPSSSILKRLYYFTSIVPHVLHIFPFLFLFQSSHYQLLKNNVYIILLIIRGSYLRRKVGKMEFFLLWIVISKKIIYILCNVYCIQSLGHWKLFLHDECSFNSHVELYKTLIDRVNNLTNDTPLKLLLFTRACVLQPTY